MEEKKNMDYFLVIVITFICLLLIGVSIIFQNKNLHVEKNQEKTKETVKDTQIKKEDKLTENMTELDKENKKIEAIAVDEVIDAKQETIQSEEDVINYVTKMHDTVIQNEKKETFSDWKEKSKKMFITLTDFIFYNGKIGNYTFDSLSDSAKAKIVDMAIRMDNKIESHYPSYKENIKVKTKNTYHNVSTWLATKKNEYWNDVKTVVGEENYQKAGDKYQEVKDAISDKTGKVVSKSKEVWTDGKEKAKEAGTYIKDKASNWYQSFKEKNA